MIEITTKIINTPEPAVTAARAVVLVWTTWIVSIITTTMMLIMIILVFSIQWLYFATRTAVLCAATMASARTMTEMAITPVYVKRIMVAKSVSRVPLDIRETTAHQVSLLSAMGGDKYDIFGVYHFTVVRSLVACSS